ncbi:replication protein P [Alishewanella sp. SMS9]|nr:replication protein P [Alishewanella sp. SMS9]
MGHLQSIQAVAAGFAAGAMPSQSVNGRQVPSSLPDEVAAVLDEFFAELKSTFPAWHQSVAGVGEANWKRTWAKGLVENGVTSVAQLRFGIRKAMRSPRPFLPSIGEFCSWCKPALADFGLPDLQVAFREACNHHRFADDHVWSHPAVFKAMRETGSWSFKTMASDDVLKLFARNYEVVCGRVMAGEDFSGVIPKALPEQVTVKTSQRQGVANCQALKAKLFKRF